MKRLILSITSLLSVATLAVGCASAPTTASGPSPATASDCGQISAQMANTQEARREALAKEQDAWKHVVPFAVVARYTSAKSVARHAEQRLLELESAFKQQGCTRQGS